MKFLVNNDLSACNTMFQHPCKHRTTWEVNKTKIVNGKKVPVYTQIDFVLCKRRSVSLLKDARSYAGATATSDHRIVVGTERHHW